MKIDPTQFFVTKIAKDDSDKLIDPGEAIAGALALGSGRLAQEILPTITSMGLEHIMGADPKDWESISQYGLKKFDVGQLTKDMHAEKLKRPILDLIKLKRLSALHELPNGIISPFRQEDFKNFQEIAPSVNKMIDRYNLAEKGVRIDIGGGTIKKFFGPEYATETKRVSLTGMHKDYALHELGHAAHLTKPGARTLDTIRLFADKSLMYAIPLSYIAGNEIKKLVPGTLDDKAITFIQNHAPAIAASSILAADVYPEVQATARAVHHVYKTEGAKAAKQTLKNLIPGMASYVLPIIPITVGIALAKKYFKEGQEKQKIEKKGIEKTARTVRGLGSSMGRFATELWEDTLRPLGLEAGYVAKQLGEETQQIFAKESLNDVAKSFWEAGKKTVKSPEFLEGAIFGGIPAAVLTYVSYNTPHGKIYDERYRQIESKRSPLDQAIQDVKRLEDKQKENKFTVPLIAGVGAALSGGFLGKFFSDLEGIL